MPIIIAQIFRLVIQTILLVYMGHVPFLLINVRSVFDADSEKSIQKMFGSILAQIFRLKSLYYFCKFILDADYEKASKCYSNRYQPKYLVHFLFLYGTNDHSHFLKKLMQFLMLITKNVSQNYLGLYIISTYRNLKDNTYSKQCSKTAKKEVNKINNTFESL